MLIVIGDVRVLSLYAISAGNYKLELSLNAKHNYGYLRGGELPTRVGLTLRITAAEAVEWLPLVGTTLPCELVGAGEPSPIPPEAQP